MSDCTHQTVVKAGNARTLELFWECLKCGIEFSPTAAAEQRGIERARKVVEAAQVENQHHRDLQLDILDALTEARKVGGDG